MLRSLFGLLSKKEDVKHTPTKKKSLTKAVNHKPTNNAEHERKAHRKGELGEFKIDIQIEKLSKEFKSVSDVLIRTSRGLTQIDHILITPVGVFVIETKNYLGKIYGSQFNKMWSQYNEGHKNSFLNPIRQNYGHIQSLKETIKGFNNLNYYSVISFTRRCQLNIDLDLRASKSEIMVVYDTDLSDFIMKKVMLLQADSSVVKYSESDIVKIYNIICTANISDSKVRAEHIAQVKNKMGK